MNNSSLSHSKYHVVFAPKYRKQIIYIKIKKDIGMIIRKLCIELIEGNVSKDHIYTCKYATQVKCSKFHGVFERKKFVDHI